MAGRIVQNQRSKPKKDSDPIVSPKPSLNLMQNCDLPPPLKLFLGSDDSFLSSITKIYNKTKEDDEFQTSKDRPEAEKLELLKALRLSQTRAREAERKLSAISKEREMLVRMFLEDSMQMSANKQWIKLLEIEVLKMERKMKENSKNMQSDCGGSLWAATTALCLAIAGMGILFGLRYLF